MATRNQLLGLDLRSLALFRFCLGLVILADLGMRTVDLRAHYTDFGVLPRSAATGEFVNIYYWSLHMANGSWAGMALLFLVAAAVAVALAVGYRTSAATIASFVLMASLHNRNVMVLDGGDFALRLLLFWSMFLPLGAVWSVDAGRRGKDAPRAPNPHYSIGSIAYLLQMCLIYWLNAINKSDEMWRSDFTAVYYTLSWDAFTTSFGIWMRQYPLLTSALTIYTVVLEFAGPFLLFIPAFHWVFRLIAVILFINLHIGFMLCMHLGVFPFILIAGWLAIVPGVAWDKLGRALDTRPQPAAVPQTYCQRLATVFCGFCLVYVTLWNIRTIDFDRYQWLLPRALNVIGHTLRIDQRWNMFAPRPSPEDGWYVIPGKLKNGNDVELLSGGGTVSFERPASIAGNYVNQRWRKYRQNLWSRDNADHRAYYARYLCRVWNEKHTGDQTLQSLQLLFMLEETTPFGVEPTIERKPVGSFNCF